MFTHYDVVVVGGGIHGAAMANEAAGRGLAVLLVQGRDLASGASGLAESLLGGGLQDLARFNLTGVSASFKTLHQLRRLAPHLVHPQTAWLASNPGQRSDIRVNAGLSIYRRLYRRAGFTSADDASPPDIPVSGKVFPYPVVRVNNRRLIIATLQQAAARSAEILPHHRVTAAQRQQKRWQLTITPDLGEHPEANRFDVTARCLINCCGWLANGFLQDVLKADTRCRAQAMQAGYLLMPAGTGHWNRTQVVTWQHNDGSFPSLHQRHDGRLMFGPLCSAKDQPCSPRQAFAALRSHVVPDLPAADDTAIEKFVRFARVTNPCDTRSPANFLQDALLDLNNPGGGAPLLNVFGIDFARHRRLACQGMDILAPFTDAKRDAPEDPLPGAGENLAGLASQLRATTTALPISLPEGLLDRWVTVYGDRARQLVESLRQQTQPPSPKGPGQHFGQDLYAVEVDYLIKREWVSCAEDLLRRRDILSQFETGIDTRALDAYISAQLHRSD